MANEKGSRNAKTNEDDAGRHETVPGLEDGVGSSMKLFKMRAREDNKARFETEQRLKREAKARMAKEVESIAAAKMAFKRPAVSEVGGGDAAPSGAETRAATRAQEPEEAGDGNPEKIQTGAGDVASMRAEAKSAKERFRMEARAQEPKEAGDGSHENDQTGASDAASVRAEVQSAKERFRMEARAQEPRQAGDESHENDQTGARDAASVRAEVQSAKERFRMEARAQEPKEAGDGSHEKNQTGASDRASVRVEVQSAHEVYRAEARERGLKHTATGRSEKGLSGVDGAASGQTEGSVSEQREETKAPVRDATTPSTTGLAKEPCFTEADPRQHSLEPEGVQMRRATPDALSGCRQLDIPGHVVVSPGQAADAAAKARALWGNALAIFGPSSRKQPADAAKAAARPRPSAKELWPAVPGLGETARSAIAAPDPTTKAQPSWALEAAARPRPSAKETWPAVPGLGETARSAITAPDPATKAQPRWAVEEAGSKGDFQRLAVQGAGSTPKWEVTLRKGHAGNKTRPFDEGEGLAARCAVAEEGWASAEVLGKPSPHGPTLQDFRKLLGVVDQADLHWIAEAMHALGVPLEQMNAQPTSPMAGVSGRSAPACYATRPLLQLARHPHMDAFENAVCLARVARRLAKPQAFIDDAEEKWITQNQASAAKWRKADKDLYVNDDTGQVAHADPQVHLTQKLSIGCHLINVLRARLMRQHSRASPAGELAPWQRNAVAPADDLLPADGSGTLEVH